MKKSTILVVAVILLSVMMFSGCSDLILKNKLLEKYSDDQNYVALSGKIVEVDGLAVVIQCEVLYPFQTDLRLKSGRRNPVYNCAISFLQWSSITYCRIENIRKYST